MSINIFRVLLLGLLVGTGTFVATGRSIHHVSADAHSQRPVLAFYYTWYAPSTWRLCHMSDLPTITYDSGDVRTIDRQLAWAAGAGITGFISSWSGPGSPDDTRFALLLARSAVLQQQTGQHFASTIYLETAMPPLNTPAKLAAGLRDVLARYGQDKHFFRWHGKPVIFIWDPLGGGRTLAMWSAIRHEVDPHHQSIWSAEGVDSNMLSVFDGLHLFSAGYWGIQDGDMAAVDAGFRSRIDAYNSAHGTHAIWAAGVQPGYDDRRVPGRLHPYVVPRNHGATYITSWTAALASNPDWITISTFNEWFEGSMIEPSVSYGSTYLALTARFTRSGLTSMRN